MIVNGVKRYQPQQLPAWLEAWKEVPNPWHLDPMTKGLLHETRLDVD